MSRCIIYAQSKNALFFSYLMKKISRIKRSEYASSDLASSTAYYSHVICFYGPRGCYSYFDIIMIKFIPPCGSYYFIGVVINHIIKSRVSYKCC